VVGQGLRAAPGRDGAGALNLFRRTYAMGKTAREAALEAKIEAEKAKKEQAKKDAEKKQQQEQASHN
jgi:hypothetical protein